MISSTYILQPDSKLIVNWINPNNGVEVFVFNFAEPVNCVKATRQVMECIIECIDPAPDPLYELEFAKFVHNHLVCMWHKQQETSTQEGGQNDTLL